MSENKVIAKLEKWFRLEVNDPEFGVSVFVLSANIVVLALVSYFAYYNMWVVYLPQLLVIDLICMGLCVFGLLSVTAWQKPQWAAVVIQVIISAVSISGILDGGNKEYVLVSALITPASAVFLLGARWGLLVSLTTLLFVVTFCLSNMDNWQPDPFADISLIHITVCYFLIFVVSNTYERSRSSANLLLRHSNSLLQKQATTDVLTGLANRRYLEDYLLSNGKGKYIAFIDVDDFKSVNDEFGHLKGDRALKQLAKILKVHASQGDKVGRWGGEEFMWIMDGYDKDKLDFKINKLLERISETDFGLLRHMTVSAGVTKYEDHRESLRRADEALYRAKEMGKNNYQFAFNS